MRLDETDVAGMAKPAFGKLLGKAVGAVQTPHGLRGLSEKKHGPEGAFEAVEPAAVHRYHAAVPNFAQSNFALQIFARWRA